MQKEKRKTDNRKKGSAGWYRRKVKNIEIDDSPRALLKLMIKKLVKK